jgi:hypothetical protein
MKSEERAMNEVDMMRPVMPICKNCTHYDAPDSDTESYGGDCKCESFKIGYGFRIVKDSDVLVEGDEGWGFAVGPEFGCVHFSA